MRESTSTDYFVRSKLALRVYWQKILAGKEYITKRSFGSYKGM